MNWSTRWRVVLDANVFISAIVWGGNPGEVIKRWKKREFRIFISPAVLMEILEVLLRFEVPPKIIKKFKRLIETHAVKIIPKSNFKVCQDPKDNKYLNLCYDCQAGYLVTGDRDLLTLKKFKKTKILKPRDFLRIVDKS